MARGGQVYVVFLTSGDGFEWDARATTRDFSVSRADMLRLGLRRMTEARDATKALGIPASHVYFLGFPDQGLTALYLQNYLVPYTSSHTGVNRVPYAGTFAPGKPYTGKELERQLSAVYDLVQPQTVLAPSTQDGHPITARRRIWRRGWRACAARSCTFISFTGVWNGRCPRAFTRSWGLRRRARAGRACRGRVIR